MKVSKKSKIMILSSFLVSAALIATVTVYAVTVSRRGQLGSAELWFVIGMVILAAVIFGLFAWFRLHKNGYVKKLDAKYFEAYEKFCDALMSAKMSKAEIREIKLDVLTLMLEAQESGRDVKEVAGDDIYAFAGRVRESFGYRSTLLFELSSILQYGIFFVTFIQVLLYFSEFGAVPFFKSEIGLSLAVMFIPIIFLIYPLLKRAIRKDKTAFAMFVPIIYGIAFIVLIIVLDNFLGNLTWVRFFLDTNIVMISSLWQLIIMAAVLAAAQIVKLYLRRRFVSNL